MNDPLGQLQRHFTGLWVREDGPQGQVYAGRDATGAEVTIAVLAGGLAAQPPIRNAFADVVWRHSVGSEPGRVTVYAADLHAPRPWAAIRTAAGQAGAEQLLAALANAAPTAAIPVAALPPPPPLLPTAPAVAGPASPLPAFAHQTPTYQAATHQAATHQAPTYQAPTRQGFPPAPPVRPSRPLPWVLGGSAMLVILLAAVVAIAMIALRDEDPEPPVTQPTTPPASTPAQTESPGPEPTDEPSGGGRPELRDVELVSLAGPNFEPGEETWTMAFPGWPFAFRAPGDWDCFRGDSIPLFPGAEIWGCGGGQPNERVNVMLWECDSGCDEDEQQDKVDSWLDEPDQAEQWAGRPTFYVETSENAEGLYTVDLSHFFGDPDSEGLRWMVGVYLEAPPDNVDDVQKTLNDILTQAR